KPKSCVQRKAMQAANSAWRGIRASVVGAMFRYLDQAKVRGDKLTDDTHKALMENVGAVFAKTKQTINGVVDSVFAGLSLLGVLSLVFLVIAFLKGFLIIGSRVVFERGALPHLSLVPFGQKREQDGTARIFEKDYTLKIADMDRWYANRNETAWGALEYGTY